MQRKVISALLAGVVVLQAAMVVPVIAQAQEKPTKISTVTTKNVTQTSITYVWQTDLHVSGYKIDRYQNKKWVTVKNITNPKVGSWKMTGLKSGTVYKVRLYKYIKTKGRYTYGEPVVYTTATNPPPVKNVKIQTGKTTADVGWSRPSNCKGYAIMFYTIKEKPQGRLPVTTKIENDYENAFEFLDQEIRKGHQCYVVAPKIESGSGKQKDVLSVKQLTAMLEKYFAQHNSSVVVKSLTGKTKAEEKTAVLKDFCNNKIQILVSTTVIEVGVNVPNATVIAISNAEMFGLASLHQLRGRVGRSNLQSYCLLISDKQDNQRLKALVETNDGFEIAKQDLKQRGSGDLTGVAQSGFTEEIAIMLNNPKMFEFTQKYAKDLSRIPV